MITIKSQEEFDKLRNKNGNVSIDDDLIINCDIKAHDINALKIDALYISAHDINALKIDALDISAHDIEALKIDALEINARKIYENCKITKR